MCQLLPAFVSFYGMSIVDKEAIFWYKHGRIGRRNISPVSQTAVRYNQWRKP